MSEELETTTGFHALKVPSALCKTLSRAGIETPTPIQAGSIPVVLEGRDLIGIAQTGTGKTLAFALPMAALLGRRETGLVIAPTRELAEQIAQTYKLLNISTALIVGGASMGLQVRDLRAKPQVIVATPGRLIDHLDRGTVRLNFCSMVVLDEADRMFDMGFSKAIRYILNATPAARQTMLFSATMPKEIEELASQYLVNPERVEIARQGTTNELVDQELVYLAFEEKKTVLTEILEENEGTVLVFARTKHGARKLAKSIRDDGHTANEIHANRTLAQRREALAGFKNGKYRVLVATDIAARGIDVKEIAMVVNFDVPENPEDYVHRIGRTGRAGAKGRAITFALTAQDRTMRQIEKLMGTEIPISGRSTAVPRSRKGGAPVSAKNPHRENRFKKGPRREDNNDRQDRRPQSETNFNNDRSDRRPNRGFDHQQGDDRNNRPDRRFDQRSDRPDNRRDDRPNRGGFDHQQGDRNQRNDRNFDRQDRPDRRYGNNGQDRRRRYEGNSDNRDQRPYRPSNDRPSNDRPSYDRPKGDRPADKRRSSGPGWQERSAPQSNDSRPPKGANDKKHRGWSGKPKKRKLKR